MVPIPSSVYGHLAVGALILGLGAAVKVQTNRLDACKAAHAAFVAQVETIGREAEKNARAKEAADKKTKERADANHKRELSRLHAAYVSMRDSRARTGFLSQPAASARDPSRACFDRSDLERILGRIDERGSGIALAGDEARVGLDSAKRWASER